jgi:hypothetical protein
MNQHSFAQDIGIHHEFPHWHTVVQNQPRIMQDWSLHPWFAKNRYPLPEGIHAIREMTHVHRTECLKLRRSRVWACLAPENIYESKFGHGLYEE